MEILELVADKKKLKIMKYIANNEDISIRDASRKTGIPVATVYRIFKDLENKNVLISKTFGGKNYYTVNDEIDLSPFKEDPLKRYLSAIGNAVNEVRLINRSDKGANVVIITENLTEFKKAEKNYTDKFKIQSIVLTPDQFQRLKQMGMVKEGEVIYRSPS